MAYLATGVPNLDTLLGGGLPEAYLIIVAGPPGTGKTVLVQQIALHHARQGGRVLYVTALSEPHASLVAHLSGFTFFDRSLLGDRIKIINVFPVARQALGAVTSTIVRSIKDERVSLLIFDGFRTLRDVHGREPEVRTFGYELAGTLASIRTTALFTGEFDPQSQLDAPMVNMADGLILLGAVWDGSRLRRSIEVVKLRGHATLHGPHSMHISRDGLAVFPRPESVCALPTGVRPGGRAAFNLPALDHMMGGGLPRGTATLIAGGPGTGKTVLGLCFAAAGAAVGEPTVFLSLRERPERLLTKADSLGLDVRLPVQTGVIRMLQHPWSALDPDRLAWHLWSEVDGCEAGRVVIDGVEGLEAAMDASRLPGFCDAVVAHLQARGATVCLTRQLVAGDGALAELSRLPLAGAVDNVLLLGRQEVAGRLERTLLVLKMRDSEHDLGGRGFAIGRGGLAFDVGDAGAESHA